MLWTKNSLSAALLFTLSVLICQTVQAQESLVQLQLTYGSFRMDDMHKMQKEFLADFNETIKGKIVSDFPAFFGYEASANLPVNDYHRMGGYLGYYSTGGKIHYSDFSGEMHAEQLLNNLSLGLYNEFQATELEKNELAVSIRLGATFTHYRISTLLQVYDESDTDKVDFTSTNFHFSPGICYRFYLTDMLYLQAEGRYEFQIAGKLHVPAEKDIFLIDDNDKPLRADWGGYRLGLAVGVKL